MPDTSALGKGCRQVDGARYLCRVLVWHSANPLPSACHVALGKDSFADHFFAEWALPRAALGKAFADGKGSFAECGRHSAKATDPVVSIFMVKLDVHVFLATKLFLQQRAGYSLVNNTSLWAELIIVQLISY